MHTALEELKARGRVLAHDVTRERRHRRATVEAGVAGQVTIGIDVGGTKVLGLALDDESVVLSEVRVPTPTRRGPGAGGPAAMAPKGSRR